MNKLSVYQSHLSPSSRHSQKALVGVIQICSTDDIEENYQKCKKYIEISAKRGAKFICLPENFAYVGRNVEDGSRIAESLKGPLMERYI